jgi:L-alanine-DL-glutamate epimerase-like enolase superfamily enzyme
MRITRIETLNLAEYPNVLWLLVHTDAGVTGLGETFYGAQAANTFVHETLAPQMLGQDPLRIEQHSRRLLQNYVGFKSTSAEVRGSSAFDIALWDLFGKVVDQPVYQLLGGRCRDRIRAYNTCAGYRYVRAKPTQLLENWGLEDVAGPYEDLDAFLHRADELAESLLAEGYRGMKIWPFDFAAEASNGTDISTADLRKAIEPFEKIRKRVGDRIDIHVELHSMWQLPAAIKIAKALEPYQPYWFEDPIKMSNLDALRRFRESTHVWVTASETLATRWASASCSRRGPPASPCSTSAGAAGSRRPRRSRPWRRPTSCPWRPTTAPGRACSRPRSTSAWPRPTRWSRRWCAPSTSAGTRSWSRTCRRCGTASSPRRRGRAWASASSPACARARTRGSR